jgi:hypothetical protein
VENLRPNRRVPHPTFLWLGGCCVGRKKIPAPSKTSLDGAPGIILLLVWQRYKPVIVLVIIAGGSYGIYMLNRYIKIESDFNRRTAIVVHPKLDDASVAEIGYIYSMRRDVFIRPDNTLNLVWFIKIPATGRRYSCSYEDGFPEFQTGDDVRIIRPKNVDSEEGMGYIVGLHEKRSGKAALVSINDEESLELDFGPEE